MNVVTIVHNPYIKILRSRLKLFPHSQRLLITCDEITQYCRCSEEHPLEQITFQVSLPGFTFDFVYGLHSTHPTTYMLFATTSHHLLKAHYLFNFLPL